MAGRAVGVSDDVYKKLKAVSEASGFSVSKIVNKFILTGLEDLKTKPPMVVNWAEIIQSASQVQNSAPTPQPISGISDTEAYVPHQYYPDTHNNEDDDYEAILRRASANSVLETMRGVVDDDDDDDE